MRIADLIAALQAGQDPNQAIPAQFAPGANAPSQGIRPEFMESGFFPPIPQGQAPQQEQAPAGPPKGIPTPVTNPQPPGSVPTITQSPPDLANMYIELMKKNQNAQALDRGMTLIAAGLSPHASTRQALIQGAFSGGGRGSGGMSLSAADVVNMQKLQMEQKNRLMRQSLIGGLAKQYGIPEETLQALEASGKMDEVLQHFATQDLQLIEDPATGQKYWADKKGNTKGTFGGPKPVTGVAVKTEEGPTVFVNPQDASQIGAPVGGNKLPPTQVASGPQGPQVVRTDTGEPVGAPLGLPATESTRTAEATLATINKEREAEGKPPLNMEQYLRTYGKGGVTVNVGPQGQQFPAPPPGQDWARDAQGNVIVDPTTNAGSLIDIPGSDARIKREKHAADLAKSTKEAEKTNEADIGKARAKYAVVSSVMAAADDAEKIIKDQKPYWPATGAFSSVPAQFGSSAATDVRAKFSTLTANAAFAQLQAMRDASPTGSAGLGSVTDFEQKMLAATFASLDPFQSDAQLLKNIRRIKAAMTVLAENDFKKGGKMNDAEAAASYQQALDKELTKYESQDKPKKGTVKRISD